MDFISKTYTVEEIDTLAAKIKHLKDAKEEISQELKEIQKALDVQTGKFVEAMEEVGKTSWKTDLGLFTVKETAYPKLQKDHASVEAFMDWMQAKGKDYYLSHVTVHVQTLKRIYKEELAQDPELVIPGVDAGFTKKSLSVRKA